MLWGIWTILIVAFLAAHQHAREDEDACQPTHDGHEAEDDISSILARVM